MDKLRSELLDLIKRVKGLVEAEKEAGREGIILSQTRFRTHKPKSRQTLEDLCQEIAQCQACPLHKNRTKLVFGQGSPKAKLVFVGEAPGFEEDQQGLPFVGKAGNLLTKIIQSIGLKRKDVYIANILKCRPPQNRNPLPSEIKVCSPYLQRQLAIIKPMVICTLGKFASQTLLESEETISSLRGKFRTWQGIKVMPTYHPAYLLRNSSEKRPVWEDMKKIRDELKKHKS